MKPFNPKTTHLGFVALGSPDPLKTVEHYQNVIGLTEKARDGGASFLSVGGAHHDIVVHKTNEKSFVCQGYQLRPDIVLEDFAKEASSYGLHAEVKTDSQPGVSKLVEVAAPGGVVFQFYTSIETTLPPASPHGIAPLRLGHIGIITPEHEKMRKFYEDFLGFHYTDDIAKLAFFYTCNRDHHVANVIGVPGSKIHHIAFELRDNGDHGKAADILSRNGTPTQWGPSRHGASHNIAAYHYDPDQVLIEFYTQMDVYLPALGIQEPRPWHEEYPMTPKTWALEHMSVWETKFLFNLATA